MTQTDDKAIALDLLDIVKTRKEAVTLVSNLEQIAASSFEAKEDPLAKMKEVFPADIYDKVVALCKEHTISLGNREAVDAFANRIEMVTEHMPVIYLYLAFAPTDKVVQNISQWFLSYLNIPVLLDFSIKKELIAGAVILYNGKYKNLSFQKKLEEFMTKTNFGSYLSLNN